MMQENRSDTGLSCTRLRSLWISGENAEAHQAPDPYFTNTKPDMLQRQLLLRTAHQHLALDTSLFVYNP